MAESEPEYLRYFPYDTPYENQPEAMEQIYASLAQGRDVLFEGACGTGKTLAALAPALEYAASTNRTVVITTNVHQQMRQFIAEARAIAEIESIRAVIFRGKSSMCHIDVDYTECQVLRDNTRDIVEAETDQAELERRQRELLSESRAGSEDAAAGRQSIMEELASVEEQLEDLREGAQCDHFYSNLTTNSADFERWLYDDVRTPDDVYEWAQERGRCGYELLKASMDGVDLVVCNYHHLLDPTIRTQFFRWLGREPDEVITVFDEAHNIESAAREHATRTLSERTLDGALDELRSIETSRADRARAVLEPFHDAVVDIYETSRDASLSVDENWTDIPVASESGPDDLSRAFQSRYAGPDIEADLEASIALGRELDERYEDAYREGESDVRRECQTLAAASFIEAYLADTSRNGYHPIMGVRRDAGTGEVYSRVELYACIPREVTSSLFNEVHASVLMSATLRPFDITATVLGIDDPATMAFDLAFPAENRRTFAVDVPPMFASARGDPDLQDIVTETLADAIEFTPGNTLVFFPSYDEAARYARRLDRPVYLDEAGTRVQERKESFIEDSNAALFTSTWGTLTEGVSFDGDAARSVVVVGVPYPHLDDRTEAVQDAYDAAFDIPNAGWEYGVEVPTIRKTRQALGRTLRSPTEIGTRILLDRRYTSANMGKYSVQETFPESERAELIDVRPSKLRFALRNFYAEHGAWDGEPPEP